MEEEISEGLHIQGTPCLQGIPRLLGSDLLRDETGNLNTEYYDELSEKDDSITPNTFSIALWKEGEKLVEDQGNYSITPATVRKKVKLQVEEIPEKDIKKYNNSLENRYPDIIKQAEKNIARVIKLQASESGPATSRTELLNQYLLETQNALKKTQEDYEKSNTKGFNYHGEIYKDFAFYQIYSPKPKEDEDNLNLSDEDLIVPHYGLIINKLPNLVVQKEILHPCEKEILTKAFKYLEKTQSAVSYINGNRSNCPCNIVLVDIVAREKLTPEIHTIALWKNKDNIITLIDPSNSSFSCHLLNDLQTLSVVQNTQVVNMLPPQQSIYKADAYVKGKKGKDDKTGYSNYLEAMPKPRDCIDIAVKIAFVLNEEQKTSNYNKQTISDFAQEEQKIIKNTLNQISNNKLYNTSYSHYFHSIVIRELHSSNSHTREEAQKLLILCKSIDMKPVQGVLKKNLQPPKNYKQLQLLGKIIDSENEIIELQKTK